MSLMCNITVTGNSEKSNETPGNRGESREAKEEVKESKKKKKEKNIDKKDFEKKGILLVVGAFVCVSCVCVWLVFFPGEGTRTANRLQPSPPCLSISSPPLLSTRRHGMCDYHMRSCPLVYCTSYEMHHLPAPNVNAFGSCLTSRSIFPEYFHCAGLLLTEEWS